MKNDARREGLAEGLAEGIAQAEEKARQEKLDTIRSLKTIGLSSEQIAAAVQGFSPEEIDKL
jgi:flagellar biosynthesis/type III secretory pathway protein FliH